MVAITTYIHNDIRGREIIIIIIIIKTTNIICCKPELEGPLQDVTELNTTRRSKRTNQFLPRVSSAMLTRDIYMSIIKTATIVFSLIYV